MNWFKKHWQDFQTARHNAKRDTRKLFPEHKHIIKYAFTISGIDYYCFDDLFNQPYERGLMGLVFYREAQMNCDKDYLTLHIDAVNETLKTTPFNVESLQKLFNINAQLKDRLNFCFDVELLYKLASIVFFDKNENPAIYEPSYNAEKIKFWRENKGVADFFLQKPLRQLMPFIEPSATDMEIYSELNEKINEIHKANLSTTI